VGDEVPERRRKQAQETSPGTGTRDKTGNKAGQVVA